MKRKLDLSSQSTRPLTTSEACLESSQPSSAPQERTAAGAVKPPNGVPHDPGPGARKRARSRTRRRFLGSVTGLERKPLFSGMTLDSIGLNFIAAHELGPAGDQAGTFSETPKGPSGGFAAIPYNNPAGNAAIGYGHLLHPGSVDASDQADFPSPIDQAEANTFLAQDTTKAVDAVNKDVKVVLTQDQFDAMVDFTYNEGSDAFAKSALLKDLNNNKFSQVPAQLERWVYGIVNGNAEVIPGLVDRRNDESNLFEGHINQDNSGDGPATGFSAGHPGNTFGGIHNRGCSVGSGETGTGGGAGNIGGGHHTGGGGGATPISSTVALKLLNSLQGYTTCDGYSPFNEGEVNGNSSPYAGSTSVNGKSAPYGTSPFCYSSPKGASPYNNYYPVTGRIGGGGGTGGGGATGGGGGNTGGGGGGGTTGGGGGNTGGGGGTTGGGGGNTGGGGGNTGGGGGNTGGGGGNTGGGGGNTGGGGGNTGGGGGNTGGGGGGTGGAGSDIAIHGAEVINRGGGPIPQGGGAGLMNQGGSPGSAQHGAGGGFTNAGGGGFTYGGGGFTYGGGGGFTYGGGLGITNHGGGGGGMLHGGGNGSAHGNDAFAYGRNTGSLSQDGVGQGGLFTPTYAVPSNSAGVVASDSNSPSSADSLKSHLLTTTPGDSATQPDLLKVGTGDARTKHGFSTTDKGEPPNQDKLSTIGNVDPPQQHDLLTVGKIDRPTQENPSTIGNVDPPKQHDLLTVGKIDRPTQENLSTIGNVDPPQQHDLLTVGKIDRTTQGSLSSIGNADPPDGHDLSTDGKAVPGTPHEGSTIGDSEAPNHVGLSTSMASEAVSSNDPLNLLTQGTSGRSDPLESRPLQTYSEEDPSPAALVIKSAGLRK